jgi:putative DNA methylase
MQAKKLIEVAMPIKEISAESVRDKSIRSGHISTLHLWWARRPLPVCRAVVFASLVNDPLDKNCPPALAEAVDYLLGKINNPGDPYKPYDDIPFTSAIDEMEDNPRNRLMMFIGKFSDTFISNEKKGKSTTPKEQISDSSLIKWENKHNEKIIGIARELIYISHNADFIKPFNELHLEFCELHKSIEKNSKAFYELIDRHIQNDNSVGLKNKLEDSISKFLSKMPKVFDPFAGGGAIPLESARLGCKTFGNDINPVAHIIQKGSLEYPQLFGKPILYSKQEFLALYSNDMLKGWCVNNGLHIDSENLQIAISNRLSYDVEYYAKKILKETHDEIGYLYPKNNSNKNPIAYYWSRVGTCSNPTCKAEVPLLKQFYLSQRRKTKEDKWIYFDPIINGNQISFEIKKGKCDRVGWLGKSLTCPCCGSVTSIKDLKDESIRNQLKEKLLAVIEEGDEGKIFRLPTIEEYNLSKIDNSLLDFNLIPNESMKEIPDLVSGRGWGINKWSQMFSDRQLLVLQTLIKNLNSLKKTIKINEPEYQVAILCYLGILIDRILARSNSYSRWHIQQDTIEHPFGRQAIPMMFDYPEMNIFADFSGGFIGQLNSILDVINIQGKDEFKTELINASSGDKSQFPDKYLTAAITDPPYYDAIAYADLSDFFYVWLKRSLGDIYPLNFSTPQTPKTEECTALKYHHDNEKEKAKSHFENKLTEIFDAIEKQTSDIVSIMFAHQSTEAWTTLCNSILEARMNITGSWAIDTEMAVRLVSIGNAALESSVTVACKPSQRIGYAEYKEIKKEIEKTVSEKVDELYKLGFRGADLLTACFGQAVSVFGKFQKVEKADGSEVSVSELLELSKEAAFNALLRGFEGDDITKFYIGWLQMHGFSTNDHNTALKIVQIGLSIDINNLYRDNILMLDHDKTTLATSEYRNLQNRHLGEKVNCPIIDLVHKAMWLYKSPSRNDLLIFISKHCNKAESSFWRVLNALCEILPAATEESNYAIGLMTNKDSLIKESANLNKTINQQGQLEF